jgi:hypothetical protein
MNRSHCLKQSLFRNNKLSGHESSIGHYLTLFNSLHEDKFERRRSNLLAKSFLFPEVELFIPHASYITQDLFKPLDWKTIMLIYCGKCAAVSQANVRGILVP